MSALSLTHAQQQFTATLAAVEDAVHYAFRGRLRPQEYEETLAEARAAAWSAWAGLLHRGTDPVEVGVHAIARNAIVYVKSGRKLGNPTCGRGARDVWHPRASVPAATGSFPSRSWPGRWSGRGRTGWSQTSGPARPTWPASSGSRSHGSASSDGSWRPARGRSRAGRRR